MPVTRSSTSVLTTGAGPGAGCSAVRQNSVPSLTRRGRWASAHSSLGFVNFWRTVARATMPVTRSSTSVLTTGAGPGAGCSAVRQNSVPSLTRRERGPSSAPVPFAGAAGTGREEATMSSRSSARLVLIVLIARLRLDASGLVVRVPDDLTALGAHGAYGRGRGAGELPNLDVDPAIELLAFPTGFVTDRAVGPDGHDLHARLGHAPLDEELFDRLGASPGQQLVVLGRALTVGVALDEDRPRAGLLHEGGLVLEQVHGLGGETGTLEVEVDVGVNRLRPGRRRRGHGRAALRLARTHSRLGRGLRAARMDPVRGRRPRGGDHQRRQRHRHQTCSVPARARLLLSVVHRCCLLGRTTESNGRATFRRE